MKRSLVLGLGQSGTAAARFLLARGWDVFGVDDSAKAVMSVDFPAATTEQFRFSEEFSRLVISPGVSPSHPIYQEARRRGIATIGEAELGLREMRQRGIAITGTNGKTTVTLLTTHVLNASGIKARAVGNVGDPFTHYFLKPDLEEVIVAELSSYQLETMETPVFDAGIILNVTPDHLDRYGSMEEYTEAKFRLKGCLKKNAPFYIHESLSAHPGKLFGRTPGPYYWTDRAGVSFDERRELEYPQLYNSLGLHDCENALAAWLLVQTFGISSEQFVRALVTFKKPAHRIEFVLMIDGISFYDDSKGTNLDAVVQAVSMIPNKLILIAGGVHKGASYQHWLVPFQGKVKKIIAIGQAASQIESDLSSVIPVERAVSLEEAVMRSAQLAETGEAVLLSPGCSSFDMFRDYVHRGEEFKRYVHQLVERRKNL